MRRSPEMQKRLALEGLCASCRKASHCTFPREPGRPVLQCEEFEGWPSEPRADPPRDVPTKAERAARDEQKGRDRVLGLCANCKHRDTCTFPRPAGGVWRCDEYE